MIWNCFPNIMNCWKSIVDCSIRINDLLQCLIVYGLEPETNIQILYSYKFLWSNSFVIFVNYTEIMKCFVTKISLQQL